MTMKAHPIIRQIIDRDCHALWTNRKVIRHVISKLRDELSTFRAMPRKDRRTFLRDCITVHRANRELYDYVMLGRTPRKKRRGGR